LYGVTFMTHDTVPLKNMLGIPDDYEIATLIQIGYPEEHFVRQNPVSLKEKTHYDKW